MRVGVENRCYFCTLTSCRPFGCIKKPARIAEISTKVTFYVHRVEKNI